MSKKDENIKQSESIKTQLKKLLFIGGGLVIVIVAVALLQMRSSDGNGGGETVAYEPNVNDVAPTPAYEDIDEVPTPTPYTDGNDNEQSLTPTEPDAADVTPTPYMPTPVELSPEDSFYDSGFLLSVPPGVHDEEFYLVVTFPSHPEATIYFTVDGTDPAPDDERFIGRRDITIHAAGVLPETGVRVADRTTVWRNTLLAARSESWYSRNDIRTDINATLLQGTSFRFQAFEGDQAVSEIINVTYIITPDAAQRFAGMPIIAVTAPYEEFVYIYSHADPFDTLTRREIFHYEFFELVDGSYVRMFDLPGSTSLGGGRSRENAQRTLNVHLSRGVLDGVVTHPVFPGLDELHRFRLWNGGNAFEWDHMRDSFAQTASAPLNVPFADSRLAIKFINGEYWGFTTIREHTSNGHFIETRMDVDRNNVVIMDSSYTVAGDEGRNFLAMEVVEGPEDVGLMLFDELLAFIGANDLSTDFAREYLFFNLVCQDNFMDFVIANTFFQNAEWPHDNLRMFRAIAPGPMFGNPYEDGKWRFILHSMDFAPHPIDEYPGRGISRYEMSRFDILDAANLFAGVFHEAFLDALDDDSFEFEPMMPMAQITDIFLVLNNPTFASQFVERALYVLDHYYTAERLLALHDEFVARYTPLLPEMYNRFAIMERVNPSMRNFEHHTAELREFIENRGGHYREQLYNLLNR